MVVAEQKGPRHQAEAVPQFRHAQAGRLPQGTARRCRWPPSSGARSSPFWIRPGAYPGIDAEERGQAEAIARNLREMARLPVPVVVVCIGEGGSGGALALGVGNTVLMLENAVYSVISPGKLRRHHLSRFGQGRTGRRRPATDGGRSARAGPDRWHCARTSGRRAGRSGRGGGTPAGAPAPPPGRAGRSDAATSWWSTATPSSARWGISSREEDHLAGGGLSWRWCSGTWCSRASTASASAARCAWRSRAAATAGRPRPPPAQEAQRTAVTNACAQLAGGVIETNQCENTTPDSVNWLP